MSSVRQKRYDDIIAVNGAVVSRSLRPARATLSAGLRRVSPDLLGTVSELTSLR